MEQINEVPPAQLEINIEIVGFIQCSKCEENKDKNEFYKNRKECKFCYNSSRLCPHDKQKTHCKICNGSQICKHSIQKSTCKDPVCGGGSSYCVHNKQKSTCRECSPFNFCKPHNVQRSNCRTCKGTSICDHNKFKPYCIICSPESKYFCIDCRVTRVTPSNKDICFKCYKKRQISE